MLLLTILFCFAVVVQSFKLDPKVGNSFNISLTLSKSIFDNYYCGNVDGFPHFKLKYTSKCENTTTHQILDREFWNDGTSPSTFFYLYNYLNQTNAIIPSDFKHEISNLIKDWNMTKMRDILLWDKLQKQDRYGVGNDDRLWYGISFMQIQQIIGKNSSNQQYYDLAVEIFEWVRIAFENNICGGGVFWDTDKSYKNSITNHLFIDLAVYLYEYSKQSSYMDEAKTVADWELYQSQLLDTDYLFFDGAYQKKICKNVDTNKWTYNQGVFIRGYLYLSSYFLDSQYENVVAYTILTMTSNRSTSFLQNYLRNTTASSSNPLQFRPYSNNPNYIVLLEFNNTQYTETAATFKGIFMRYLGSAYTHFSKSKNFIALQVCSEIEKYVFNNVNYIFSLADNKNSYPFYWNQTMSVNQQTFTAGTSTTVLDLFTLYDLILKQSQQPQLIQNS